MVLQGCDFLVFIKGLCMYQGCNFHFGKASLLQSTMWLYINIFISF